MEGKDSLGSALAIRIVLVEDAAVIVKVGCEKVICLRVGGLWFCFCFCFLVVKLGNCEPKRSANLIIRNPSIRSVAEDPGLFFWTLVQASGQYRVVLVYY